MASVDKCVLGSLNVTSTGELKSRHQRMRLEKLGSVRLDELIVLNPRLITQTPRLSGWIGTAKGWSSTLLNQL